MNHPARIAVFASGGGTNLQALLDHFNRTGQTLARIELLVASRTGIGAIARAERAGVPILVLEEGAGQDPAELSRLLPGILEEQGIDLIALAGYLKLIPATLVARYSGRILNIHPALLPSFGGRGMYGVRVHRAVLASGARVSGATVHLVDERYDEGRIVAQWPVPVLPGDTPERLGERVLRVEHLLYPLAIEAVLRGATAAPHPEASFGLVDAPAPPLAALRSLHD